MAKRLAFRPDAAAEALEAYRWYEMQSEGLGERFRDHVDECIGRILKNPELFEVVYKQYRRAIVRDFPYAIFYACQGDAVTIHSVFHSAQNPRKWRRRLR